ncbi:MAG: carbohydrate ABC transporter permease [Thermomicrobiales bacterium]
MRKVTRSETLKEPFLTSAMTTLALSMIVLIFGAPFVWIIAQAIDNAGTGALPIPREPSLDNFRVLFDDEIVRVAIRNSVVVSMVSMGGGTLFAALAGFGLSRLRMKRKEEIVYAVILLYAIPLTVTMIAIFELAIRLELSNNLRGLIVAEIAVTLPFLAWLMKGFYDAVPEQIDEAVMVDGGSIWRAWWNVLTPAVLPGLGIVAGLAFVISWSDALLPIVLISDPDLTTLARFFFSSATTATSHREMAALGVVFLVPVLVVVVALRSISLRTVAESDHERM